jgi:hypothetical protein
MKKLIASVFIASLLFFSPVKADAQCSICTKSAQQLGDQQAKGLNLSIFYLAFAPFLLIGIIGYRWYKSEK